MNIRGVATRWLLLCAIVPRCDAGDPADCFAAEVRDHVLRQFAEFGPLSREHEYFGYIYRVDGAIHSAVTRGANCRWTHDICEVSTRAAAARIPAGAKVLGEWHTHPRINAAAGLSDADVHGANDNRHIRCYHAFYSTADGDMLSWDPDERAVREAMASRIRLGNYKTRRATTIAAASR